MIFFLLFFFKISFLFGAYPNKEDISSFLDAKFSGDTSLVNEYISDNFIYYHAPFIGLGIKAFYVDGGLLVTDVFNDSLQTNLSVGDRIHEFNGHTVNKEGILIKGAVGDIQEFIATEREAKDEKEIPYMTTSIKADETVKMGIITDVKQELRKANSLKILHLENT